jgi:XTP/dITP diphosphohydrolase
MELLVATRSAHKLREIRRIMGDVPGLTILGLEEAGVPYQPEEDALEPYDTFEDNARSKARYFHEQSGLPTVADDSGIEVDALDGAPGVRSKRFAPDESLSGLARDLANNDHLLALLGDRPPEERGARYVCVAVLIDPDRPTLITRGEATGVILDHARGQAGFGYDPLFLDPDTGRTFAELTQDEKNERSHRGRAFRALAQALMSGSLEGERR